MQISTGQKWFGELIEEDGSWALVGRILERVTATLGNENMERCP